MYFKNRKNKPRKIKRKSALAEKNAVLKKNNELSDLLLERDRVRVCKNVLKLNKKVILKYTGAFVTMQGSEYGSSWRLPLEGCPTGRL